MIVQAMRGVSSANGRVWDEKKAKELSEVGEEEEACKRK